MRYLSLCSGIEAASVAWEPLGWEPVAFAEIEAFPSAVLKAHYPEVPNLGDITKFQEWPDLGTVDLVCGGTPCQSFSVAGLRAGLADPRGNLMLTFLAITGRYRPRWVVWENVPGVLSSDGGRDFGTFLSGLGQLGYGWAYRVLDAQYVRVDGFPRAVPQRRRRVFVVGCLGDWAGAAAVLSERQSLLGDTAPRRTAGQGPAPSLTVGAHGSSGHQCRQKGNEDALIPQLSPPVMGGGRAPGHHTLDVASSGHGVPIVADPITPTMFRCNGATAGNNPGVVNAVVAFTAKDSGGDAMAEVSPTLRAGEFDGSHANGGVMPAVAFDAYNQAVSEDGATQTLCGDSGGGSPLSKPMALTGMAVRRLTPRECERLQGFPDDYTLVTYRGKPAADGPRYRALGNAWAVNCARWVGTRIAMVEALR